MKDLITINAVEYKLGFSLRARIIYEQIAGKPMEENMQTLENIIFFYSILCAFNRDTFKMNFDEFLDYLENHEGVYGDLLTWANDYYERRIEGLFKVEDDDGKKKE